MKGKIILETLVLKFIPTLCFIHCAAIAGFLFSLLTLHLAYHKFIPSQSIQFEVHFDYNPFEIIPNTSTENTAHAIPLQIPHISNHILAVPKLHALLSQSHSRASRLHPLGPPHFPVSLWLPGVLDVAVAHVTFDNVSWQFILPVKERRMLVALEHRFPAWVPRGKKEVLAEVDALPQCFEGQQSGVCTHGGVPLELNHRIGRFESKLVEGVSLSLILAMKLPALEQLLVAREPIPQPQQANNEIFDDAANLVAEVSKAVLIQRRPSSWLPKWWLPKWWLPKWSPIFESTEIQSVLFSNFPLATAGLASLARIRIQPPIFIEDATLKVEVTLTGLRRFVHDHWFLVFTFFTVASVSGFALCAASSCCIFHFYWFRKPTDPHYQIRDNSVASLHDSWDSSLLLDEDSISLGSNDTSNSLEPSLGSLSRNAQQMTQQRYASRSVSI